MTISELLFDIGKRNLVLPEFQREYVWSRDQAKQLMVSLLKSYPVGGLLFWKTDDPPELKNIDKANLPAKLGTVQVLLDGQQRLTTLHMLITGEIPCYYREVDIESDPRDLYFSLDSGEFQYYQASRMKGNPLWQRVVDCFASDLISVFQVAKSVAQDENQAFELAERYMRQLSRLRNIREITLPVQVVPSHATMDEAIDIFDKVNSQGTKLTEAELALTHVTGKWPTARRELKAKIEKLSEQRFYFDLTFMTRALTGVVARRALFETIHERSRPELEDGWAKLQKILDYLVVVLPSRAFVDSTRDLSTANVLVPLIVHLSENKVKFGSDKELREAVHWLYAAQTWARYTGQTDQRLEHDVSIVIREASPWDALRAQIIDQRGRIDFKSVDFEGRGVQHPLYQMAHILAKAHSAIDWFNGLALGKSGGGPYYIHSHHIFPQGALYKNGYDPDNHLHRTIINEIANRAFLTADTNLSIKDRLPEEYLPEVEQRFPGALVRQFVPMDPELWKLSRFEDFLAARRETLARKLNEFMQGLISAPTPTHERPIKDLIALGESSNLEFKSSLQWDIMRNELNKNLRHSSLKTIAAFLNTDGGTLLIGVEDSGVVLGLASDLKTTGDSRDKYLQLLYSLVFDLIGPNFGTMVKARFEEVDGGEVCVVDVDKALEPAYLGSPKGNEFYVRVGNTTRALDIADSVSYILSNWGQ